MSHPSSIAALTWGYALFFHGTKRQARPQALLLLGSGLLLGIAVGIRYTNALLILAPMLWFLLRITPAGWSARGAWFAGLAVPGTFLAWFHWSAFGHPLNTGYSLTDEQSGFALSYFARKPALLPRVFDQGGRPPVRAFAVRIRGRLASRLAPRGVLHGLAAAPGAPVRLVLLPPGHAGGLPALPPAVGRAVHSAGAHVRQRSPGALRRPYPRFLDRCLDVVPKALGA